MATGTLPELLALSKATQVIELRLLHPPTTLASIEAIEGVEKVEAVLNEVRIFTNRAQHVLPRIYATSFLGRAIVQTRVTPVTLDYVFLELTGKELRD